MLFLISEEEDESSYLIPILYLFTHPGICALPPLPLARSRRVGNNHFHKNSTVTFIALFVCK